MLREEQDPPCETSAEQYEPTSVSTVLGNPSVRLKRVEEDGKEELVKRAPTAADIAGLDDPYHLELPGDPLGDTCVYARDFAKLKREGKAPPTTYAHIARQVGRPGLVVQYWFFWYFNQFNDLHEGDWEGMQIAFEANTARQALAEGPSEMILFQHAGGERADWEDSKVEKEGTHPIVYPAAGSHATFYDSTVYVQNGSKGSGVGCDNTSEPLLEVRPDPIAIPTFPTTTGRFKWLTYFGHWGQKEAGFNNGPTGPLTKTQWLEPFSWMEKQRTTSPRVPGGSFAGPAVSGAFCGAVATVSDVINLESRSRPAAIAMIAIPVLLLILFVGVTRWGPVDLTELRRRRAFGQIVRAARQLYGRHWRTMVPIGLSALVIVGGVRGLAALIAGQRGIDSATGRSGAHLGLADTIESLGLPIAEAIVAAVVIFAVRLLLESGEMSFLDSWRGMLRRFWRVAARLAAAATGRAGARDHGHRDPHRGLQDRLLAVRPAGDPHRGQGHPRRLPRQLRPGARPLVARRPDPRLLLAAQHRRRPGARLHPDLHQLLAALDQRDRLGRLRPARPLRGARPHTALLRPRHPGRGGTGEALARAAAAESGDGRGLEHLRLELGCDQGRDGGHKCGNKAAADAEQPKQNCVQATS